MVHVSQQYVIFSIEYVIFVNIVYQLQNTIYCCQVSIKNIVDMSIGQ